MELTKQFQAIWPTDSFRNVTSVIGVSGGADSIAMARIVRSLIDDPSRIIVAHFNHRLRGLESDSDETFVREFSKKLDFGFCCERASLVDKKTNCGEGLESLARNDRYAFFRRIAKQNGARYVALAHTRDDQVETVLHRIFRGTGWRGMQGIPIQRDFETGVTLIRPLIECKKLSILKFLKEIDQGFRTDQSNFSNDFTRNRIRNELIPIAADIFQKDISESIDSVAESARDISNFLKPVVDKSFLQHIEIINDQRSAIAVRTLDAGNLEPVVLSEILCQAWQNAGWPLQQMTRQKWKQLVLQIQTGSPRVLNWPGNLSSQVNEIGSVLISEV